MKILLTTNFGEAMEKQPQKTVGAFIEAINKLENMAKPQILLLEAVTDLSAPDDKITLYTYHIANKDYVVFTFTPKNEMLLIDYITLSGSSIKSVTYPEKNTIKDSV